MIVIRRPCMHILIVLCCFLACSVPLSFSSSSGVPLILNLLTTITSLHHVALAADLLTLFFATHLHLLVLLLELCGTGHSLSINVAHAFWHSVYYASLCHIVQVQV